MGCEADAQTSLNFSQLFDSNNVLIGFAEHRYSTTCLAQWERTRNISGGDLYGEGSIRWGGIDYTPNIYSNTGLIPHNQSVYTPMYALDIGFGPALTCGSLSTIPVSAPPQPINLNSTYGQNNCTAH